MICTVWDKAYVPVVDAVWGSRLANIDSIVEVLFTSTILISEIKVATVKGKSCRDILWVNKVLGRARARSVEELEIRLVDAGIFIDLEIILDLNIW